MSLRSKRNLPMAAVLAVLVIAGAALAAGCGESGDSDAAKDAAVLNAINILDKAGLHDIDDSINDDRTIPANAKTIAQQLQAITNLTEWPDDLESQAEALATILGEMAAAVDGDNPDLARAGEAATKAHDAQHDFSHDVWAHLYERGGVETGSSEGH